MFRAVAAALLVLAACGDAGAAPSTIAPLPSTTLGEPLRITVDAGVPFTTDLALDVYRPIGDGSWPVVVLFPGGSWARAELESTAPFARYLAERGAVVYNATYRLTAPEAFGDVVCAVRLAGETAAGYGGDPDRLVLAGHSAGAHVTSVVALSGEEFPADCVSEAAYVPPAAWVGISGPYDVDAYQVLPTLQQFLGGPIDQSPASWERANPYTYLDRRPDLTIGLVHGLTDVVVFPRSTREFVAGLAEVGRVMTPLFVPGARHSEVIDPDRAGPFTAGEILRVADGG